MKKKLLFIMNDLSCGGAEKALVSLLNTLDYNSFDVDLFLFKKEGLFLNQVPKEVTILPVPVNYPFFDMSIGKAISKNLKSGNFKIILNRLLVGYIYRTTKTKAMAEQKSWKYLSKIIKPLNKQYDAAIGFLEKKPNYFCVDKVSANIKIGFIMNDYEKLNMVKEIDNHYFKKLTYIVCDSEESKVVLIKTFPQFQEKFRVIKTIISPKLIEKLAKEEISKFSNYSNLISVGRLAHQKGYDLAIDACKILVDKGIKFKWYILGNGEDKQKLTAQIKKNGIEKHIEFLGITDNHYPFLKQADIFLHTARFEGFGIVISEAKILNKPMVLSNFNVAKSHITHLKNGLIADLTSQSIAENLEILINDKKLQEKFSNELKFEAKGTEDEIENFYKLINYQNPCWKNSKIKYINGK
ncbi:glycosyltransferase [Yeosuana marina]|uniref:glycosyltransferase n=1 Tax=Yeosuana marina TaxID=1565536 RepID=UPI0030C87ADC